VIDCRTKTHAETAILKERLLIAFHVLQQCAEREPDAPIVPMHFRNTVQATGKETGIQVSKFSGTAEKRWQSCEELSKRLLGGEAEIDRLCQSR
jgi:hypothetical protein